jgi:hypothetical protein
MSTKTRITVLNGVISWGDFPFVIADLHPSLINAVIAYGLKQIISDAGAVPVGTDEGERIAKMTKRANGLRDGTWSYRDGTSEPKPATEFANMYAALIAADAFEATDATAALWSGMKPSEKRAVFAACPAAAAHMPSAKIDGASILARMQSA